MYTITTTLRTFNVTATNKRRALNEVVGYLQSGERVLTIVKETT